ncbi:hypothetical protein [Solibacillus cecembensis]|uniref:hypothetical protein n=1 Tax=Solibacillus cecembensis TaxID=459347 RepID=UPI000AA96C30
MNQVGVGGVLVSFFSIFGLLFTVVPIIFFLWFAITTTKQLKMQTKLLEEIKARLNS